jgi:hypothetical protein
MPQLFPTFDAPDLVDPTEDLEQPNYGTSWLFDFEKGDFVSDGAGRVVTCDGYTAWVQWCVKAVLTERLAYPAYSQDYGVEMEEAQAQTDPSAVESEIERTITEALLMDPRTESVQNFSFDRQGDQLTVSFDITPTVGTTEHVEVTISG